MAKNASLIMGQMSGKLGDARFYVRNGVQCVRKATSSNSSKGVGATLSQRVVRLRMASLASMYNALKPFMQYAFQSKTNKISDYNAFVRANASENKIMYTKSQVALGAQCVGPVVIANGTLPEIKCTLADDFNYHLNVKADINESTTVAQFAHSVVAKNYNWKYGDKLTIVLIQNNSRESFNTNVPYCTVQYAGITLDANDNTLLSAIIPDLKSDENSIYIDDVQTQICTSLAACHSRKNGSELLVSPTFVNCDKDDEIQLLLMKVHIEDAMESYGYKEEALLEPGELNIPVVSPDAPSVTPQVRTILVGGAGVTPFSTVELTEPTEMEIVGSNLAGNVVVRMGANTWSPLSATGTSVKYSIASAGTITVSCGTQSIEFTVDYNPSASGLVISSVQYDGSNATKGGAVATTSDTHTVKAIGTGFTGIEQSDVTVSGANITSFSSDSTSCTIGVKLQQIGTPAVISVKGNVLLTINFNENVAGGATGNEGNYATPLD